MANAKQQSLSAKVEQLEQKLDQSVDATARAITEMTSQFSRVLDAINNPVAPKYGREFDAASAPVGQIGDVEFDEETNRLEPSRLLDVASPEFRNKAENLAFATEKLSIHIHDTSEKNAQRVFEVSVNGHHNKWIFERGKTYHNVPRNVVERLALARPIDYECEQYTDKNNVMGYRYPSKRGLRFPFSVVADSDRGKAWLANLLQAA